MEFLKKVGRKFRNKLENYKTLASSASKSEIEFLGDWVSAVSSLSEADVRFLVYDLEMVKRFNFNDVTMTSRNVALVSWVPEKAPVKKRMLSATVRPLLNEELFRRKFDLDWTFGDRLDLDLEERVKDLKRMRRYKDVVQVR